MKKAVCILASPNPKGNTATIVSEISRALADQHIQTRFYLLSNLNIAYCLGCKHCERTGKCIQEDDVQKIMEEVFDS